MGHDRLAAAHVDPRLAGVSALAYRALLHMAFSLRDDDPEPVWFGLRPTLAAALYLPEPEGEAAARRVNRLMKELVDAGMLRLIRKAAPGRGARYAVLLHGTWDTDVPRSISNAGHESPERGTPMSHRGLPKRTPREGERVRETPPPAVAGDIDPPPAEKNIVTTGSVAAAEPTPCPHHGTENSLTNCRRCGDYRRAVEALQAASKRKASMTLIPDPHLCPHQRRENACEDCRADLATPEQNAAGAAAVRAALRESQDQQPQPPNEHAA